MSPNIIQGHDNPNIDVAALRDAINNRLIDTIVLRGRFDLGGTSHPLMLDSNRQTVVIPRGVTIKGEEGAEVIGGGAELNPPDLDPPLDFQVGKGHSGPFMVKNLGPEEGSAEGGNDKPVIFENIRFSGWRGEAIFALACHGGLEVTNCTFTNPVPGTAASFEGFTFVHAVLAIGSRCKGHLFAWNNQCFLTEEPTLVPIPMNEYEPFNVRLYALKTGEPSGSGQPPRTPHGTWTLPLANDEQFLACVGTNFSSIDISENLIRSHDDGIEVILNENLKFGSISVKNNDVILEQLIKPNAWGSPCGIVCCNNQGTPLRSDVAEISGNFISVTGIGTGLVLSSQRSIKVSQNTLYLHSDDKGLLPLAGLMLGANYGPPGFPDLGPSLNHSEISRNHLTGQAIYGIWTFDANDDIIPPPQPAPPANDSHDNTIADNDLHSFKPIKVSLFLGPHTWGNTYHLAQFPGREPGVSGVDDRGNNNQLPIVSPKRPELRVA